MAANSYDEDPVISLAVEPSMRDFKYARILEVERRSEYFRLPKEMQPTREQKRAIHKHNQSLDFYWIDSIGRYAHKDDIVVYTEKSVYINGVHYLKYASRHKEDMNSYN